MIFRRAELSAEKCAARDFRREDETEAEYFILAGGKWRAREEKRGDHRAKCVGGGPRFLFFRLIGRDHTATTRARQPFSNQFAFWLLPSLLHHSHAHRCRHLRPLLHRVDLDRIAVRGIRGVRLAFAIFFRDGASEADLRPARCGCVTEFACSPVFCVRPRKTSRSTHSSCSTTFLVREGLSCAAEFTPSLCHAPPHPTPYGVDYEKGWAEIKVGLTALENILEGGLREAYPLSDFQRIYHTSYTMSTQRTPHNHSEKLYHQHSKYFEDYQARVQFPKVQNKTGLPLLKELETRWQRHLVLNQWMYKFFQYLDRYHTDHHNFPKLEDQGNTSFKDGVYVKIRKVMTEAVLTQVNAERDGEVVDRALLKKIVSIYQKMSDSVLEVYERDFERPLLAATKAYFNEKGDAWIETSDVPTYLARVEDVLVAEAARVKAFMHEHSEQVLRQEIELALLTKHQARVLSNESSGLNVMLASEKHDDLARLYRLYHRVGAGDGAGLQPVAVIFKEYFQNIGFEYVREREAAVGGDGGGAEGGRGDKESADNPEFVRKLLDLHEKAQVFAKRDFESDQLFLMAIKDAFEAVVNKPVQRSKIQNVEIIAHFADRVLKGTDKLDEEAIERALTRIVSLFTYITEKDVFSDIYRNLLSKRLLSGKSSSNDAERSMISKLKLQCGAIFTTKIEGMINDLGQAGDIEAKFKQHLLSVGSAGGSAAARCSHSERDKRHTKIAPHPFLHPSRLQLFAAELTSAHKSSRKCGGQRPRGSCSTRRPSSQR